MKYLLFASIFLASPAFASGINDQITDIRRMIATSLMRQQGRNLLGTDKDYPGQKPPIGDNLKAEYCLDSDKPKYLSK